MTLDQVDKGSQLRIVSIPDGPNKSQLIRLGIVEGARVVCEERLPAGPVILKCNRQEIAVGHQMARGIQVNVCDDKTCESGPTPKGFMGRFIGRLGGQNRRRHRGR